MSLGKKVLGLYMSFVLVFGLCPMLSFADEPQSGEGAQQEAEGDYSLSDIDVAETVAGESDDGIAAVNESDSGVSGDAIIAEDGQQDAQAGVDNPASADAQLQSEGPAEEAETGAMQQDATMEETNPDPDPQTDAADEEDDSDVALEAQDVATYRIVKSVNGNGTVTITGDNATLYPHAGDVVTYRTAPNLGYKLAAFNVTYVDSATGKLVKLNTGNGVTRVSGTGKAGTNSTYSFTMPKADVTINATFVENHRNIAKSVSGSGQIMIVANAQGVATISPKPGDVVRFKVVPEDGCLLRQCNYRLDFTGATSAPERVGSALNTFEFTMPNEDVTITAKLTAAKLVKKAGAGGSITIAGDNPTMYPYPGDTVTYRTEPNLGYKLETFNVTYVDPATGKQVKYNVDNGIERISGTGKAGTNSTYAFTMPYADVTINATFAENHHQVSKWVSGSGSVTLVANDEGVSTLYPKPGDTVRFKVVPSSGYRLIACNYTFDSTGGTMALSKVSGTSNVYELAMPNDDVTINAEFEEIPQASSGSGGSGSGSGGDTVYVTKSGSKYHHSWCPTLSRSRVLYSMTISEAQRKGYGACKVCF